MFPIQVLQKFSISAGEPTSRSFKLENIKYETVF